MGTNQFAKYYHHIYITHSYWSQENIRSFDLEWTNKRNLFALFVAFNNQLSIKNEKKLSKNSFKVLHFFFIFLWCIHRLQRRQCFRSDHILIIIRYLFAVLVWMYFDFFLSLLKWILLYCVVFAVWCASRGVLPF